MCIRDSINIMEIKVPDTNAQLVAENIAQQLEKRISFRLSLIHICVFILWAEQDGNTMLCGPKIQKILAKPLHLKAI